MQHIVVFLSLAAFCTAPTAQTLNLENILQHGVNEVIRSMTTPAAPPPQPIYTPSLPRSTPAARSNSSTTSQVAKARSASEQEVDARIADMLANPTEFQAFFNRLKKAVAASDKKTLAKMMRYPLNVTDEALKIFTKKDFTDNYDRIFTPTVITAIKQQSYADLFVRDTGAAVGDGVLWFTGVCTDSACKRRIPKVVGVYAPSTETDAAAQAAASQPSVPAQRADANVVAGLSLAVDHVLGEFGPCRNVPDMSKPNSLTITGSLEPDVDNCYRLTGHNGQTVRIELKSVSAGFSIPELAENRYELEFKTKNQTYDILVSHTFPNSPLDHYQLHFWFK